MRHRSYAPSIAAVVFSALFFSTSLLGSIAHAQEDPHELPPAPPPQAPAPDRHWYGWETLAVDGATLVIGGSVSFAGLASSAYGGSSVGLVTGASILAGGYGLGGPLVHAAHGHWGKAAGSLGTRIGAPLVFALLGRATTPTDCQQGSCGVRTDRPMESGAILGIISAIVLDAAVFANEDVEPGAKRAAARSSGLELAPSVNVGRDRGMVGVEGVF
jgi:hypothetical protein